jgi:hypothetical protein
MAARRLPVLGRDPLEKPKTVRDCRNGVRPCPFVTCRYNLLVDVLEDGMTVLNAPSRRLAGADRAIPAKHDAQASWYVIVKVQTSRSHPPQLVALGPCEKAPIARRVAAQWRTEFGKDSAYHVRDLPDGYERMDVLHEGEIDRIWNDEVEDAVNHWFDEPDPNLPSCVLDEVSTLDRDDDEHLLQQIARHMHVSRERVRQVEAAGLSKLRRAGFAKLPGSVTLGDVLDED